MIEKMFAKSSSIHSALEALQSYAIYRVAKKYITQA